MSRSLRRDDGFYLRGVKADTPRSASRVQNPKPRTCVSCDTVLSIYNPDDYCAPCNRKAVHAHLWRFGACEECGTPRSDSRSRYCSTACHNRYRARMIREGYARGQCKRTSPKGTRCIHPELHPGKTHSWSNE